MIREFAFYCFIHESCVATCPGLNPICIPHPNRDKIERRELDNRQSIITSTSSTGNKLSTVRFLCHHLHHRFDFCCAKSLPTSERVRESELQTKMVKKSHTQFVVLLNLYVSLFEAPSLRAIAARNQMYCMKGEINEIQHHSSIGVFFRISSATRCTKSKLRLEIVDSLKDLLRKYLHSQLD